MSAWTLPPLSVGDFAPGFEGATRSNPQFHFETLAGRYILLGFLPRDLGARAAALAAFEPIRSRFDDLNFTAFFVTGALDLMASARDVVPGQRWFFDPNGEIARLYHALDEGGGEHPHWLLIDPMLRILDRAPIDDAGALFARLGGLGPVDDSQVAPVAIVPRVFEPALCKQLIGVYEAQGGQVSGVMRDIGGKTMGVLDSMKRRRDAPIEDPELRRQILLRLKTRLAPMVRRAFQFEATRVERHIVACYDAGEGGWFRPHRDNTSMATAHRRFAVSINLNAEVFDGGDLRFPEFGRRTYRPPTGGAVVFCCALLHEATPVTRGRRYAFLPFLYDEAGVRIRQANAAFLDQGPALVLDDR